MSHCDEPTNGSSATEPAGPFGDWLAAMQRSLRDGSAMDVPCGTCTACCRSAQFVHIGADERDTLARIPAELLFTAPGRPGEWVLGFDRQGHCPMLDSSSAGGAVCSIYQHRPRACRSYDCRVFTAAGLDPADDGKARIAERTRRWRFDYRSPAERQRHQAVADAARQRRAASAGAGSLTELALIAVREVSS